MLGINKAGRALLLTFLMELKPRKNAAEISWPLCQSLFLTLNNQMGFFKVALFGARDWKDGTSQDSVIQNENAWKLVSCFVHALKNTS